MGYHTDPKTGQINQSEHWEPQFFSSYENSIRTQIVALPVNVSGPLHRMATLLGGLNGDQFDASWVYDRIHHEFVNLLQTLHASYLGRASTPLPPDTDIVSFEELFADRGDLHF